MPIDPHDPVWNVLLTALAGTISASFELEDRLVFLDRLRVGATQLVQSDQLPAEAEAEIDHRIAALTLSVRVLDSHPPSAILRRAQ